MLWPRHPAKKKQAQCSTISRDLPAAIRLRRLRSRVPAFRASSRVPPARAFYVRRAALSRFVGGEDNLYRLQLGQMTPRPEEPRHWPIFRAVAFAVLLTAGVFTIAMLVAAITILHYLVV
jgi:hypothetical protein